MDGVAETIIAANGLRGGQGGLAGLIAKDFLIQMNRFLVCTKTVDDMTNWLKTTQELIAGEK